MNKTFLISIVVIVAIAVSGALAWLHQRTPSDIIQNGSTTQNERTDKMEGTSQTESNDNQDLERTNMENQKRALVLYFSQMGHAQTFAQTIATHIDGELLQILPAQEYPEVYEELADLAKAERDNNERPEIANLDEIKTKVAAYDTIFLGYPIWWYQLPMILDTLFDNVDFSDKTIIQFNTHEGSGEGGTTAMIRERTPGATVQTGMSIRGGNMDESDQTTVINEWLDGLEWH